MLSCWAVGLAGHFDFPYKTVTQGSGIPEGVSPHGFLELGGLHSQQIADPPPEIIIKNCGELVTTEKLGGPVTMHIKNCGELVTTEKLAGPVAMVHDQVFQNSWGNSWEQNLQNSWGNSWGGHLQNSWGNSWGGHLQNSWGQNLQNSWGQNLQNSWGNYQHLDIVGSCWTADQAQAHFPKTVGSCW
jgi:hypothetical protein